MTGGFLNLLKPPGMTSHDMVTAERHILHEKRVGHAGTLDPGAAGVLPVAVGSATRLIEYLELADKTYRAEVFFGAETDSGDDTGHVIRRQSDVKLPSEDDICAALQSFTGGIEQVPPVYSAIKIGGRRACDLVRSGHTVEIPSRHVTIHRLDLLERRTDTILIDVDCSKGTYIRTLCTDIGHRLGIPACMSFLVRSRVGDFHLTDSYTLEELKERGENALLRPEECLSYLVRFDLTPGRKKAFQNGLTTTVRDFASQGSLRVYADDEFLGIGRIDDGELVPVKVLRS